MMRETDHSKCLESSEGGQCPKNYHGYESTPYHQKRLDLSYMLSFLSLSNNVL